MAHCCPQAAYNAFSSLCTLCVVVPPVCFRYIFGYGGPSGYTMGESL